jgi:hypothetical protein
MEAVSSGILGGMGRGADNLGSSLLYGALAPIRSRPVATSPSDLRARRLSIPISEHTGFKPLFGRLGLQSYVPDPAIENGGYSGGRWWQAMGDTPKAWTSFKSSEMMNSFGQQVLAERRRETEIAYASDDTLLCELGDVEQVENGTFRRKVMFGTEDSKSSVDADHFEAMSRVILTDGGDIHETRFLSKPRAVACFDEHGSLVGLCVALKNFM